MVITIWNNIQPVGYRRIMLLPKFRNSCTNLIDRPSNDGTNNNYYFLSDVGRIVYNIYIVEICSRISITIIKYSHTYEYLYMQIAGKNEISLYNQME